jgi:hypothetical protein
MQEEFHPPATLISDSTSIAKSQWTPPTLTVLTPSHTSGKRTFDLMSEVIYQGPS